MSTGKTRDTAQGAHPRAKKIPRVKAPRNAECLEMLIEASTALCSRLFFVSQDSPWLGRIRDVSRDWRMTTVMIEQNVADALNIVQRVIVLANGAIAIESDSPKELLHSGKLEDIFLGGGQT